jgi:uncharacterized membrane protein YqaE (UPF0057 family)
MKFYPMKQGLMNIVLTILIFVLTYTAFSKLFNFTHYARAMYAQPLPRWNARLLIYLIPTFEVCLAIMLILSKTRKPAYWASAILMTSFTAYVLYIKAMGLEKKTCPCGGLFSDLNWNQHLWINIALTVLSWMAVILYTKNNRIPGHGTRRNADASNQTK